MLAVSMWVSRRNVSHAPTAGLDREAAIPVANGAGDVVVRPVPYLHGKVHVNAAGSRLDVHRGTVACGYDQRDATGSGVYRDVAWA